MEVSALPNLHGRKPESGRCIIVGAAPINLSQLKITEQDFLIAADGGCKTLRTYGLTPHLALGDWDSGKKPKDGKTITVPVEKDDTDMFLAIKEGLSLGYREFHLYGGLGGKRFDHSLANLSALIYLKNRGAVGYLYSSREVISLLREESITIPRAKGAFSVFSVGDSEGVTLRGVKYPLEDGSLTQEFPLGVSNHFLGEDAYLQVKKGTLLLVREREKEATMQKAIGFIGAGKVGCAMARHMKEHNRNVLGFYSKTLKSAEEAAEFTHTRCYLSLADLVRESHYLFLTVPDGEIEAVWEKIKKYPLEGKVICHTSGLLSSSIFEGAKKKGAFPVSVHMMCAFGDRFGSWKNLEGALLAVEGAGVDAITPLFERCKNPTTKISAKNKPLYHAAAVFASNFSVALAGVCTDMLLEAGFSAENAATLLNSLITGNVKNIVAHGPAGALSGPLERGDKDTISAHLSVLPEDKKELYRMLSRELLPLAEEKNPDRDYTLIKELLK